MLSLDISTVSIEVVKINFKRSWLFLHPRQFHLGHCTEVASTVKALGPWADYDKDTYNKTPTPWSTGIYLVSPAFIIL